MRAPDLRRTVARWAGYAGVVGAACFFTVVTLLHFLQLENDTADIYVSELARGEFGQLLSATFLIHGLMLVAMSAGLTWTLSGGPARTWAAAAMANAGLCLSAMALFPADAKGTALTQVGAVHNTLTAVAFLSLSGAILAYQFAFRRDNRWRVHRAPINATAAFVFAIAAFLLVLLALGVGDVHRDPQLLSVVERVLILGDLGWVVAVSTPLQDRAMHRPAQGCVPPVEWAQAHGTWPETTPTHVPVAFLQRANASPAPSTSPGLKAQNGAGADTATTAKPCSTARVHRLRS